jgi:hypothetical protein
MLGTRSDRVNKAHLSASNLKLPMYCKQDIFRSLRVALESMFESIDVLVSCEILEAVSRKSSRLDGLPTMFKMELTATNICGFEL